MSAISEAIKQLREKTGAGMLDCRTALESADGDVNKAVLLLKEQGLLQAQKRQDREANEGRVFLKADRHKAVLLRLACETDFVARNASFVRMGEECLDLAFNDSGEDELLARIRDAAGRIKENIELRSLRTLNADQDERLFTYLHDDGRIGAAVSLAVSAPSVWESLKLRALAADLTLQVAAFGPRYVSRDLVDSHYIEEKEKEFLSAARALSKPQEMIPGIVRGKMNKHLSTICLLEQAFIREEKSTVATVLERLRHQDGLGVEIRGFLYESVRPS